MEKLDIEQILKDNHFNALNILSKVHCKDGISGTEKDRLLNGIKAIIEKTVEITLDEAADNAETKDNVNYSFSGGESYTYQTVDKKSIYSLKDDIIKQFL